MADRKSFDLGKLAEEAHAQAARRLLADEADEMRRDEIIAVELLLDRTILLGKIDRRADRSDQHQVVRIARNPNRDRARVWLGRRCDVSTVHRRYSSLDD